MEHEGAAAPDDRLSRARAKAAALAGTFALERYAHLHAVLLGVAAFLAIQSVTILDVTNIAWLENGDAQFQYLGWAFFRDTPWTWPLAANPRYGMEFSGSILYSDSNPLLALLFKPLSPILPHPFQYYGLWILLCFMLQAVTGRYLMSLASRDRVVQLLGAAVITCAPVFLIRQGGHFNLVPHWLVIGAVALCLTPQARRPILWWGLLVVAAFFVHPYFVPMIVPLWGADWLRRKLILGKPTLRSFIEPLVIVGSVVVLLLVTGVASAPGGSEGGGGEESLTLPGLGWFSFNALSFFDAWPFENVPYTFIMPDIVQWGDDFEGFVYLGTGGLILVAAALVASLPVVKANARLARLAPIAPLALAIAGLIVFALSPNVAIGPWRLVTLPWPGPLEWLGGAFRSTARFAWPLYYLLFAIAVWILAQRLPRRALIALVAVAAVVQLVDGYPGWRYFHTPASGFTASGKTWSTTLNAPFWEQAAGRYGAIRFAPPNNSYGYDRDLAMFASLHGLSTDGVFLTRSSPTVVEAVAARIETMIASGDWDPDTLYILDEEIAARAAPAIDRTRDLLAVIDGRAVIAPGWRACTDCVQPDGDAVH